MLTVVSGEDAGRAGGAPDRSVIDEIVREGARAMLAAALRAEVAAYVEAHAGEVDEHGRRLVVRDGYAEPRQVLTGVRADGCKELLTLADGFRESEGSWAALLRDAARRGMRRAAGPPMS